MNKRPIEYYKVGMLIKILSPPTAWNDDPPHSISPINPFSKKRYPLLARIVSVVSSRTEYPGMGLKIAGDHEIYGFSMTQSDYELACPEKINSNIKIL